MEVGPGLPDDRPRRFLARRALVGVVEVRVAHGLGGQMGNTRGNGQQNPQVLVLQNKRTRVLEGWKPYVFDEHPQMVGWHVVERATSKGAGPIAALGFWPMIYGIVLVPVLIC